jgi:type VI secretion system secreted protein VgrG
MLLDVDEELFVEARSLALRAEGSSNSEAGGDYTVRSSTKIALSAPEISLKSGGNLVKIDASGVTIVGTLVRINSGGSASEVLGMEPLVVTDAEKAAPAAPSPADDAKTGQKSC